MAVGFLCAVWRKVKRDNVDITWDKNQTLTVGTWGALIGFLGFSERVFFFFCVNGSAQFTNITLNAHATKMQYYFVLLLVVSLPLSKSARVWEIKSQGRT